MHGDERWKKARVRLELKERAWVTHWVSSRGKGYGLHVMIGNNLWRKRRVDGRREGEHMGTMKYVGSEIKACLWKRETCTVI